VLYFGNQYASQSSSSGYRLLRSRKQLHCSGHLRYPSSCIALLRAAGLCTRWKATTLRSSYPSIISCTNLLSISNDLRCTSLALSGPHLIATSFTFSYGATLAVAKHHLTGRAPSRATGLVERHRRARSRARVASLGDGISSVATSPSCQPYR
jgi:hypothetical protein